MASRPKLEIQVSCVSDLTKMPEKELVPIVVEAFAKLRPFLPHIRELHRRFTEKRGQASIDGCTTWKDFCKKRLHRTPEAIRQLMAVSPPVKKPLPPDPIREQAFVRFEKNPEKCFQRHMREIYGELENKPEISSLDGARVEQITNEQAADIILKYEWLGTMASGTIASYGLLLNGELLGAVCFGKNGSQEALAAINPNSSKVVCLVRGACVPHSPKNAASFLIRYATKKAHKDFGWTHFLAYSDPRASEDGQIYRTCNWKNLGVSEQGTKKKFVSPDGTITFSSYNFNERSNDKFFSLGWNGTEKKYDFLRRLGYREQDEAKKDRWLWKEIRGDVKAAIKRKVTSPRATLHALIDRLSEDRVAEVLAFIHGIKPEGENGSAI